MVAKLLLYGNHKLFTTDKVLRVTGKWNHRKRLDLWVRDRLCSLGRFDDQMVCKIYHIIPQLLGYGTDILLLANAQDGFPTPFPQGII